MNNSQTPTPDLTTLDREALARMVGELQEERSAAMNLLNPACADETLEGAIRNLQQAYVTERGNAEDAERMVGELQQKIAQMDKLYVYPAPSVPNPCTICGFHIYGSYTGDGDGSMKNGGRFAHPECYEKRRMEAERDEARAGMAWLVDFLLSFEQVNATAEGREAGDGKG